MDDNSQIRSMIEPNMTTEQLGETKRLFEAWRPRTAEEFKTIPIVLSAPSGGVGDRRVYPVPNALKVMMVWVSWMPGITWIFSLTKWPISVSLST